LNAAGYVAPSWLRGGHAQTIYPLLVQGAAPAYRRERWETPDGDFIDLDWLASLDYPPGRCATSSPGEGERPLRAAGRERSSPRQAPLLVLFHGLEGSSRGHYARAMMRAAARRGWAGVVPHFRGCSGEPNRLARAYHSGDFAEIDWILRRMRALDPARELYAVGISLGGSALLNWLGREGAAAGGILAAAAAVCVPLDLAACGHALGRGFNRLYTLRFLRTMKPRAEAKWQRFPGSFDRDRMRAAHTLYDFDDAVTAPLHGFAGVEDYWTRASSRPWLAGVGIPTLVLNALNDPFVPRACLPAASAVSASVHLEYPRHGGHVGFVAGRWPANIEWLPERVLSFLAGDDASSRPVPR
jgi:hypothetical protein